MLIGLGLGPGDKELLTLKAVRLLKTADKVFVPGKIAYDLVKDHAEPEILDFPMTGDEDLIRKRLEAQADRIAPFARKGTAVFGMIGDPSFYSTFSRLCQIMSAKYPEIEFQVEPGISSITAFASRVAGLSINGGFVVSDGPDPESLVLLKIRHPKDKVRELKERGYNQFFLAERIYMPGERIYNEEDMPENSDYFSIMFARR
ncbi:MAG: cobalt-factor II C(20)-methyltransferase [Methanomassiliicoccales archaeon]|jgi:precorrin-2/cobalt-factor-2 C20-methyltransferase